MLRLLARLRNRLRYRRFADDLDEELAHHRSMTEQALRDQGIAPEEAAFAARRALGNDVLAREAARGVWVPAWLDGVRQDLRYAARGLRRAPGFAATAIATLALATGLGASLFAVFNALALRPWPVRDPGRIVTVFTVPPRGLPGLGGFPVDEWRLLREQARTATGVILWRNGGARLGDGAAARQMPVQLVSGNFFDVLGVGFAAGRGFREDEDRPAEPQAVAVLSHDLWTSQFGGDPGIVGRTLRLDGVAFTVVGVVEPAFTGTTPDRYGAWLPVSSLRLLKPHDAWVPDFLESPTHCCSSVAARLRPGVSREEARAELEVLDARYRTQWGLEAGGGIRLEGTAFMARNKKVLPVFGLMGGAVLLILLLACANVGNLMLARGLARQREVAVRLSIGASRRRVIRQLLTEGLVVAGLAGGIGLAIAAGFPALVLRLAFENAPVLQLGLDANVMAFTLAVSAAAALLSSLAPALRVTRPESAVLREVPIAGGATRWLRSLLMGAQLALGVMLLTGAALMARGIVEARTLDPGFAIDDVIVASVALPAEAYGDEAGAAFMRDLETAARANPALAGAALASNIPLGFSQNRTAVRLPGEDPSSDRVVQVQLVTPGYFDVLRIPLEAGRVWDPGEAATATVVNEALAIRLWPDRDAVGQSMIVGTTVRQVTGVARDSHVSGLQPVEPMFFVEPGRSLASHLLVRETPGAAPAIASLVAAHDRRATVETRPLAYYADRWLQPARVGAGLAVAVGLLALVLAAVGVWGVFAYVVQERRREIGVRRAVGARGAQIVALVLARAGRAAAVGLAVGAVGAAGVGYALRGYLYGASPLDPAVLAAILGVLGAAAVASTFVPVRRALRVDPAIALRTD